MAKAMRSSIFNFDKLSPRLNRRHADCIAGFAIAFFASVTLGLLLVWHTALFAYAHPLKPYLSDGQWYLAWERRIGHRDHEVLFYGIGESIDHAKRADILFLGNSRTQFGFSSEVLTEFFASRGLRFFNLSFGHGEMDAFPLLLIKKFDLRPKWPATSARLPSKCCRITYTRAIRSSTIFGGKKSKTRWKSKADLHGKNIRPFSFHISPFKMQYPQCRNPSCIALLYMVPGCRCIGPIAICPSARNKLERQNPLLLKCLLPERFCGKCNNEVQM